MSFSSSDVCGDGAADAVWRCSAPAPAPHPHLVPGLLVLAWSRPEGLQLVQPHCRTFISSMPLLPHAANQKLLLLNNVEALVTLNSSQGTILKDIKWFPVNYRWSFPKRGVEAVLTLDQSGSPVLHLDPGLISLLKSPILTANNLA